MPTTMSSDTIDNILDQHTNQLYTTIDVLATAHKLILNHHWCFCSMLHVNPPTVTDNKALYQQLQIVQHHQKYPSRSALTNPTPPLMP